MRKRIPASLLNRVEKLEAERRTEKVRPVMMVPRLVHVDQWGELAANMQSILKKTWLKIPPQIMVSCRSWSLWRLDNLPLLG